MAKKQMTAVPIGSDRPRMDTKKIPNRTKITVGQLLTEEINRYFQQPGVKEAYEAWLVEYRKRQAEGAAT